MKTLVQILIPIFMISCGENQTVNKKADEINNQNQKELNGPLKDEFKPDSSYVKFWCSIEVLKKTEYNINNLDSTTVAEFLASFHEDCSNNVEFSEWSNELLFKVANNKPDLLLQLLNKTIFLDKELIRSEFENPINDRFDLAEIIKKIEFANSPKMIKDEVIESLKKANEKFN